MTVTFCEMELISSIMPAFNGKRLVKFQLCFTVATLRTRTNHHTGQHFAWVIG